ncbi:hypothetical protein VN12_09560 [Pirellula sp. SH-Sr6A]|uniref:hypothetical protein n=1 Tax=Pirellula sp. SH-Sr6A TaxID=1632865 RepID=UPI00078E7D80|nr:hypothetical protein [Pirellula sp. SH-Sr6A]AMV32359.1 hypothetical protein VN12_09560 [Pirellula sp. SH-Sr6A]
MHRNTKLAVRFFGAAGLALCLGNKPATAQDSLDFNEAERMMSLHTVELRDQLVFGLRTTQTGQQAFIDHVIARVEAGDIPRSMVNVVFVWARKRNPRIPYPYFEIALRLLAERRGVVFPETDSIVIAQP